MKPIALDRFRIRRAVTFAADIGAPILAGTLLGTPRGALLGGIAGLLFSFADSEGSLPTRLWMLALAVLGFAVGGFSGFFLRGHPPAFWVLFVVLALAAGALNRIGRGEHLGARFAAISLAVVAGMPMIVPADGLFLVGAAVFSALVRTLDHRLNGPWPPPPTRPVPARLSNRDWIRFSLAYAAVSSVGLWIGVKLDPGRAIWVAVPCLVLMQPDVRSNYRRVVENIIGTVLGVVAAWVLTQMLHAELLIFLAILLFAALIPHHLPHRFWLHSALVVVLLMLVYDFATADTAVVRALLVERLRDILLGCALALAGTLAAHPRDEEARTAGAEAAKP